MSAPGQPAGPALQPRWLSRRRLAEYVSISPASVKAHVEAGRLPPPSMVLGSRLPRWDREMVDQALLGPVAPSAMVDAAFSSVIAKIRSRGRRRREGGA